MTGGLAWLNDLMTWLGRWVPRLQQITANQRGVRFHRGQVSDVPPGVCIYWPIVTTLTVVSTLSRSNEIAAQIHGKEAISLLVEWRIFEPATVLVKVHDPFSFLDDKIQAALSRRYSSDLSNDQICGQTHAELDKIFENTGIQILEVDIAQRGPVRVYKKFADYQADSSKANLA